MNNRTLPQGLYDKLFKRTRATYEIERTSIEQNGRIIVTDTVEAMFDLMNLVSPEHLEIAMEDAYEYLPLVKHVGRFCRVIIPVSRLEIITQGPIMFCQLQAPAVFIRHWVSMILSNEYNTHNIVRKPCKRLVRPLQI